MKQFSKRNVLAAVYPNLNVMRVRKREKKSQFVFYLLLKTCSYEQRKKQLYFFKDRKNKRNKVNFYKLIENTQRTNKYVVLIFNV